MNEQKNVMRKQRNWERQLAAKKSKRKEEKQRRKNNQQGTGKYRVKRITYTDAALVAKPKVIVIYI